MSQKQSFHFEDLLAELQQLVSVLEQNTDGLEDSLKPCQLSDNFTGACQKVLQDTSQPPHFVITDNGTPTLELYTDE